MTAPPDPSTNVAVEIAQLRGEMRTGLEEIKGTLAVLVERTNRTDADVRQLRADMDKEIEALRAGLEEIKKSRWPLAQVGALVAFGGLVVGVLTLFVS